MDINTKMAELQDKIVEAVKSHNEAQLSELKQEIADLRKEAGRFKVQQEVSTPFYGLKEAAQLIAENPAMQSLHHSPKNTARIVIKENPYDLEKKSLNYGQNLAAQSVSQDMRQILAADQRQGIISYRMRPPAIRDLIPVVPTTAEFINYVRETAPTNNANWVATANLKPESAMAFQVERSMIETIAHTMTVPLQLARDVNGLNNYIQNRMVQMLRIVSEDSYLYGNGTSPNIRGITNFTGIQTLTQVSTDNRIDTIRKALNALEVSYYPWADAIVVHPNDVVKMELLKDSDKRYLWPVFGTWANGVNAQKSLFGVPLISTTAITEGTALVGNFGQGVTLYQREDVTVDFSFEHADYFAKNLMMMRVESRECLVPEDARCFCLTTFLGGSYD